MHSGFGYAELLVNLLHKITWLTFEEDGGLFNGLTLCSSKNFCVEALTNRVSDYENKIVTFEIN